MTEPVRTDLIFAEDPDAERWLSVLSRITTRSPNDLDAALAPHDTLAKVEPGRVLFATQSETPLSPGSHDAVRAAVGVYCRQDADETPTDIARRAANLAALAIERDCEIVALSDGHLSGLERFGVRTERIAGSTPAERDVCFAQIRDFWALTVIV